MNEYWLITYSWVNNSNRLVIDHYAHEGTVFSFICKAIKQPENWRILNQVQVDRKEFLNLKDRI